MEDEKTNKVRPEDAGTDSATDALPAPLTAQALEKTQISKYYTKGGHGFAAEDANHFSDTIRGKKTEIVGTSNEFNGADRIVGGVRVQSKYFQTAPETVAAAFDSNSGNYRYPGQVLEVPKDQYETCVELVRDRIAKGKVPGFENPQDAEKIVQQGTATYKQARNIARAEQSNADRFMYIDELNREARSFRFERSSCVVDGCNNKPISSHLIPKSWQSLIARDGLVVDLERTLPANTPTTREEQFYENYFQNVSRPIGINIATADPVFCSPHDRDKRGVGLLDEAESELRSTVEQHVLFYKAICFSLFECERVLYLLNEIMERRPRDTIKRGIYFQEQQRVAHLDLLSKFLQCLEGGCDRGCAIGSHMEFRRLSIKGDGVPTISAIGCGSGLVNCGFKFECRSIGCEFARSDFMVACKTHGKRPYRSNSPHSP